MQRPDEEKRGKRRSVSGASAKNKRKGAVAEAKRSRGKNKRGSKNNTIMGEEGVGGSKDPTKATNDWGQMTEVR